MAGRSRNIAKQTNKNGSVTEWRQVYLALVGGTQNAVIGPGWQVVGAARIVAGAGALGNVSYEISGDVLTATSDAATDVSTHAVLLVRGGSEDAVIPSPA